MSILDTDILFKNIDESDLIKIGFRKVYEVRAINSFHYQHYIQYKNNGMMRIVIFYYYPYDYFGNEKPKNTLYVRSHIPNKTSYHISDKQFTITKLDELLLLINKYSKI